MLPRARSGSGQSLRPIAKGPPQGGLFCWSERQVLTPTTSSASWPASLGWGARASRAAGCDSPLGSRRRATARAVPEPGEVAGSNPVSPDQIGVEALRSQDQRAFSFPARGLRRLLLRYPRLVIFVVCIPVHWPRDSTHQWLPGLGRSQRLAHASR